MTEITKCLHCAKVGLIIPLSYEEDILVCPLCGNKLKK